MKQEKAVQVTPLDIVIHLLMEQHKKGYGGLHTVYSGLNTVLREKLDIDPVQFTSDLVKSGDFNGFVVKGGYYLFPTETGIKKFSLSPPQKKAKAHSNKTADKIYSAVIVRKNGKK